MLQDISAQVLIAGQRLLFDRPEFASVEKIRGFMRAFEEKERLLELLDRTITAGGVQVLIGAAQFNEDRMTFEKAAEDDPGTITTNDLSTMPYLGFGGQFAFGESELTNVQNRQLVPVGFHIRFPHAPQDQQVFRG